MKYRWGFSKGRSNTVQFCYRGPACIVVTCMGTFPHHFFEPLYPWPRPFSIHARHLTIFHTLIHPSLNLSLHTPPHPVSMPSVLIKPNLHPSYPLSAPITMPLPPNPYSHTHLLHHVSFTFIYPLLSLNLHAFVPMQAQFRHPSLKPKKSVNHPW